MVSLRVFVLVSAVFLLAACGDDDSSGTPDGGRSDGSVARDGGAPARDAALPDGAVATDASGTDASGPPCGNGICASDEDATSCCADCGVCGDAAYVTMQTGVVGGVHGPGITPGGMADTHAGFAGGPFAELVFPFTVTEDPGDTTSYFWAEQFFFEGTTQGGYTGVQTNGIIAGATVGKMMIFSIWDSTAAEPGDPEARCEPFGGEGIGYSCRLPFDWRVNVTYRLTLREAAADRWSLTLTDPSTGAERVLGTITVLPGWGRVTPTTAGFAEYYGTTASCTTLPRAVAVLHQPMADGTAPMWMDGGEYGTCMAQSMTTCTGAICR